MSNKGQVGIIGIIFLFIVFLIIWLVFLGGWVQQVGHSVATGGNVSGVEAFFFDNMNIVIIIAMILGMLGWMYFGRVAQ